MPPTVYHWTNDKGDDQTEKNSEEKRAKERRSSVTVVDVEASRRDKDDGHEEEGDIDYRSLAWWQGSMLMLAETVSLGVLSIPYALRITYLTLAGPSSRPWAWLAASSASFRSVF